MPNISNMPVGSTANNFEQSDFLSVLIAAINKGKRETKVATLGIVQSKRENHHSNVDEVFVTPFPLMENEEEKNIVCYCLNSSDGLEIGDVVFVVFADRDFISNLRRIKSGHNNIMHTRNKELHSEQYGIIIRTY